MHVGTLLAAQKDHKIRHSHWLNAYLLQKWRRRGLANPLRISSSLLCQKVLVVLFAFVKARCWIHASKQGFPSRGLPSLDYFLGSLLLLLVDIPYSRSILTISFIVWLVHLRPRNDQIFVRHHRWVEFDKQSFRVILNAWIGGICFFTARISDGTSCNSVQLLEPKLRSG